jgi:hypothetical protein
MKTLRPSRPLPAAIEARGLALVIAIATITGCGSSPSGFVPPPGMDSGMPTGDASVPPADAATPVESGTLRDAATDSTSQGDAAMVTEGGIDAGPPVDPWWTGRPPAAPLFVRNPYLNVWSAADSMSGTWPTLWVGATKGMVSLARVDGVPHLLVGALSPSGIASLGAPTTLVSHSMTPTTTRYVFGAGGVSITMDFLSPVEIADLKMQSAPIGFLTMTAASTDGQSHAVSFYVDISGEWANGDSAQSVQWQRESVPHAGGTLTVQSIASSSPLSLSQSNEYVQWGTAFVAADAHNATQTTAIGSDVSLRTMAVNTGALDGSIDTNMPRAINANWPVLGFAFDLGMVAAAASAPVTLEMGLAREPAVSYQKTPVPPLWKSYWSTWEAMVADAYDDAPGAASRALALDTRIVTDARAAGGDHYAALCTLALRQAFGGTELVGTATQPWLFLKEISSDGNVSTVDVVYPASPVFLYTNPMFLKLLLDPLLAYAESGLWPAAFSMHDIGASYPNADGHNDGGGENMPVEETANMLLMMAAYTQRAKPADARTYALSHYVVARKWADFLVANGLDPTGANKYTTDDFCTSEDHNANLSLKAVLAVGAMGILATAAGNTSDASSYSSQAQSLMAQWATKAMDASGTHTLFAYDQPGTWGVKYNAFFDRALKLNLIPAAVLAADAAYYKTQALAFGVPLDSRFTNSTPNCVQGASKTDWQLWMASATTDASLAQTLIDGVYGFATTSNARVPFSDYYDTKAGQQIGFQARPVQGGMFSLLAMSGGSIVPQ